MLTHVLFLQYSQFHLSKCAVCSYFSMILPFKLVAKQLFSQRNTIFLFLDMQPKVNTQAFLLHRIKGNVTNEQRILSRSSLCLTTQFAQYVFMWFTKKWSILYCKSSFIIVISLLFYYDFLTPRFVSDELICETCNTKTTFKCHFKHVV